MADSPSIVGHDVPRSAFHSSFDVRKVNGDYKLVVILVEFTDVKHETSRDVIHDMVFTEMNQYWREVSYGQFSVIGDTVGWIGMGHNEAYYGKDTDPKDPGSDQRDPELIADACRLAKGVDFSQYQDIMVVYAGHGQDSDPKDTDLLWPSAFWSGLDVSCGRKTFDHGGSTSEITEAGVLSFGAFTHEFGHTIGLPDLYDGASSSQTDDYVGLWSLMADGSWGGPDSDGSSPTGLESWSRTKLGWLSSMSITLTSDGSVQTLNQIEDTSGQRALKIATKKASSYYLIEARERTGVDEHLPDSGVLITRIDETRESGEGIVRVMDCHPETASIDDATCKVDESWEDRSNSIYVKVIGRQGISYVVAIAGKPISIIQVAVAMDPNVQGAEMNVDRVTYSSNQLPTSFVWIVGSQHVLEVQAMIEDGSGIRYIFVKWDDGPTTTVRTVTASYSATYTAKFKTQYLLTVESPIGDPQRSGWYDAGSTVRFSVSSPLPVEGVMGLLGRRYVLDHWSGDSTATTPTGSVTMNRPKTVRAEWRTEDSSPYVITGAIAAAIIIVALLVTRRRARALETAPAVALPVQPATAVPSTILPASGACKFCIECGAENAATNEYCTRCGMKLVET
jgi:M6 family metalloprotease-like protein